MPTPRDAVALHAEDAAAAAAASHSLWQRPAVRPALVLARSATRVAAGTQPRGWGGRKTLDGQPSPNRHSLSVGPTIGEPQSDMKSGGLNPNRPVLVLSRPPSSKTASSWLAAPQLQPRADDGMVSPLRNLTASSSIESLISGHAPLSRSVHTAGNARSGGSGVASASDAALNNALFAEDIEPRFLATVTNPLLRALAASADATHARPSTSHAPLSLMEAGGTALESGAPEPGMSQAAHVLLDDEAASESLKARTASAAAPLAARRGAPFVARPTLVLARPSTSLRLQQRRTAAEAPAGESEPPP